MVLCQLSYSSNFPGNEWWDLCAGPHVESTGNINRKAVELESVAGAYWRGDTDKPMLQRIYGTAWENEEQLKAYVHFKEEAKRRDHRRIGQDLDLFSIQVNFFRSKLIKFGVKFNWVSLSMGSTFKHQSLC